MSRVSSSARFNGDIHLDVHLIIIRQKRKDKRGTRFVNRVVRDISKSFSSNLECNHIFSLDCKISTRTCASNYHTFHNFVDSLAYRSASFYKTRGITYKLRVYVILKNLASIPLFCYARITRRRFYFRK